MIEVPSINRDRTGEAMDQLTTVGIDLAKDIFAVCVLDTSGTVLQRRVLRREPFMRWAEQLSPAASQWKPAVLLTTGLAGLPRAVMPPDSFPPSSSSRSGRGARTMRPMPRRSLLRPASPAMRFVAIKSVEQQAILAWHSVRQGWQERTALLNRTRGLLAEFGVVIARSGDRLLSALPILIEDAGLPDPVRAMLLEVREQLVALNLRLAGCDQQIAAHARCSDVARRAGELFGVGPLTSSAVAATVPDAKVFRNGRQVGAWLGLTPQQHSSGGRTWRRTYQLARLRLSAHAACSGRPKRVAVGVACGPHARKPATTVDRSTPRTQGLSQDADCVCSCGCDCGCDCHSKHAGCCMGDARKKRTLRCRCVAAPSGTSAVTTRFSNAVKLAWDSTTARPQ